MVQMLGGPELDFFALGQANLCSQLPDQPCRQTISSVSAATAYREAQHQRMCEEFPGIKQALDSAMSSEALVAHEREVLVKQRITSVLARAELREGQWFLGAEKVDILGVSTGEAVEALRKAKKDQSSSS